MAFEERSEEEDHEEAVEDVGHGWREVNVKVLDGAPCTVAILVDRGLGSSFDVQNEEESITLGPKRVCIIFFGGPDDREVLELGGRMANHEAASVRVTLLRFVDSPGSSTESINNAALWPSARNTLRDRRHMMSPSASIWVDEKETEVDEAAVAEFRRRHDDSVDYIEKHPSNIADEVLAIGRSGEYGLIMVGRGRFPSNIERRLADHHNEIAREGQLGFVGNILAQSDKGIVSSVLVVQHNGSVVVRDEVSEALAVWDEDATTAVIDAVTNLCEEISP
ncbi:hypothetical protein SAY86_014742 [Trapa natans]|uniref:Uncharacterized protein n=1 Tax=Trapa natans TaxID=22666 RepID=A0AAN7KH21_TRANT|nr:hypothetical protein SAY86_014742 [Trapa natans]